MDLFSVYKCHSGLFANFSTFEVDYLTYHNITLFDVEKSTLSLLDDCSLCQHSLPYLKRCLCVNILPSRRIPVTKRLLSLSGLDNTFLVPKQLIVLFSDFPDSFVIIPEVLLESIDIESYDLSILTINSKVYVKYISFSQFYSRLGMYGVVPLLLGSLDIICDSSHPAYYCFSGFSQLCLPFLQLVSSCPYSYEVHSPVYSYVLLT